MLRSISSFATVVLVVVVGTASSVYAQGPSCVCPQWEWGQTGSIHHYYSEMVSMTGVPKKQNCSLSTWDNWDGPAGQENPNAGCIQDATDCGACQGIALLTPSEEFRRPRIRLAAMTRLVSMQDQDNVKPKRYGHPDLDTGYSGPTQPDFAHLKTNHKEGFAINKRPVRRVTVFNAAGGELCKAVLYHVTITDNNVSPSRKAEARIGVEVDRPGNSPWKAMSIEEITPKCHKVRVEGDASGEEYIVRLAK